MRLPANARFARLLRAFLSLAAPQSLELSELQAGTQRRLEAAMARYAEDAARLPAADFFSCFARFTANFAVSEHKYWSQLQADSRQQRSTEPPL